MAKQEDVYEALSDAIVALAKKAGDVTHTSSSNTLKHAAAASQLAEALAWFVSPTQAHGGTGVDAG